MPARTTNVAAARPSSSAATPCSHCGPLFSALMVILKLTMTIPTTANARAMSSPTMRPPTLIGRVPAVDSVILRGEGRGECS